SEQFELQAIREPMCGMEDIPLADEQIDVLGCVQETVRIDVPVSRIVRHAFEPEYFVRYETEHAKIRVQDPAAEEHSGRNALSHRKVPSLICGERIHAGVEL